MKLKHKKVLVLGDVCLDHFVRGECYGIAPEAAVPVLKVREEEWRLGMAANVAVKLKALMNDVTLFTAFRDTDEKRELFQSLLENHEIKHHIVDDGYRLTIKQRTSVGTTYLSRNDYEQVSDLDFVSLIRGRHFNYDAVILSDYGKSVISRPTELIAYIKEKNPNCLIFVDPDKNKSVWDYEGAYCIKANEKESALITGENTIENALKLMDFCCQLPIITLGDKGCVWRENEQMKRMNAKKVKAVDPTGCGDSFIASLVCNTVYGSSTKQSIKTACDVAAKAVQRFGT